MKILFDYRYLKEFIEYKKRYKLLNFISVFIYIFFLETLLNISYLFKLHKFKFLNNKDNLDITENLSLKIENYF